MRNHWKMLLICGSALAVLIMVGCGSDSATDPGTDPGGEQPQNYDLLDITELATPDLSFFTDAVVKEAQVPSHFAEARAYVQTLQHNLQTPVGRAFAAWEAAAAVTPTIVDGVPRWDYPYTDAEGMVDISIVVRKLAAYTEWTLNVSDPSADPPLVDHWWVYAVISDEGIEHNFSVNPLDEDDPIRAVSGSWGTREGVSFVNYGLTHFGGRSSGDRTYFEREGPFGEVRCVNDDLDRIWRVIWNETENRGGLTHPDYNGGYEVCWDDEFADTSCF